MTFQSIGKNKAATFLSALRSGLIFIPLILILPKFLGLLGIQCTQTATDALAFFITLPFAVSFFKKLPNDEEAPLVDTDNGI